MKKRTPDIEDLIEMNREGISHTEDDSSYIKHIICEIQHHFPLEWDEVHKFWMKEAKMDSPS